MNLIPRHYVFDGFESSEEFRQHLNTLLEWKVENNQGLANLGVQSSQEIDDLEANMAHLI